MADGVKRTGIKPAWKPDAAEREFGESRGIKVDRVAEMFVAFHLARGSRMASWPQAWRTWCLKEVEMGRATGERALPLLTVLDTPDPTDSYGVTAWARRLPDAAMARISDDVTALCLAGWDVALVARELCAAVGLPTTWRGDLDPIAEWLRAGVEPEQMLAVVKRGRGPTKPGSWRYYHAAMLDTPREEFGDD